VNDFKTNKLELRMEREQCSVSSKQLIIANRNWKILRKQGF